MAVLFFSGAAAAYLRAAAVFVAAEAIKSFTNRSLFTTFLLKQTLSKCQSIRLYFPLSVT
jgi:hypothetical protein